MRRAASLSVRVLSEAPNNYVKCSSEFGDALFLFAAEDALAALDAATAHATLTDGRLSVWRRGPGPLADLPVVGEATLAAEERPSGTWWNVSRKGAA